MEKKEKENLKKEIKSFLEKFAQQQMQLKEKNKGLIILIEGLGTSGKGEVINNLIDELNPKFYKVENMQKPTKDELRKPFIYRYFQKIPEIGKISILNSGWLLELSNKYVKGKISKEDYEQHIHSIQIFEKQLKANGYIIAKIFLDIKKDTQKNRIKNLLENKETKWRIDKNDIYENKHYNEYKECCLDIINKTKNWLIVEDKSKKEVLRDTIEYICDTIDKDFINKKQTMKNIYLIQSNNLSINNIDLNKYIDEKEYKEKLKTLQKELHSLQSRLYQKKIPVVIVYEGWDAAGKGGNIKRVCKSLDARGFEIIPIASPSQEEKNRHYLWRFWSKIPKSGHITIFDRSWYGRVMVERIEKFCKDNEWRRAYQEINEFEQELTNWGAIVVKFWVQIDKNVQLERFNERKNNPEKQWKITEEDWRNRDKWDKYEVAINEMLQKTNTSYAPWFILESNDKKYARIKALETLIKIFNDKLNSVEE